MKNYLKNLIPFIIIFMVIQTVLRISLFARALFDVDFSGTEILQMFMRGIWFDIAASGFVLLPIALFYLFTSRTVWPKKAGKVINYTLLFLLIYSLLFDFVAEHLFWSEFATRFNFIAVDYLVYTQEVIQNIVESYPLAWILTTMAVISAFAAWVIVPHVHNNWATHAFSKRLAGFAVYAILCAGFYNLSNANQAQFNDNAEASEVTANGIYNLFHAFWNNEISYERFYAEENKDDVAKRARDLLSEENNSFEKAVGTTRIINPKGNELHKNVILVVMESMSASYMKSFGNSEGLTPNLDALADSGLLFTKAYATGTRTVRGLEAVTLSIPPTPGQSILRRPNNDNLFSLGFIFKDRGYDTKFIYGGYGYFDNMNAFFEGNGFDILDRTKLDKDEVHFANAWGVADDDVFARAIKEADKSFAAGKPFMDLIMTTSNHRPYTFPDGKIDIPSKSGRNGGVKYADYSVGQLIEMAKNKPWFKDTVFVFVADHTAGAGGKAELDLAKYHIPMIFYSPDFIKPQKYEKAASQIDLAPILLGQLNFKYRTKFYGEDLIHDNDEIPHFFISNYQKIALVKNDEVTILAPKKSVKQFDLNTQTDEKKDQSLVDDTIAYYQSASWWRENYKREDTVLK